MVKLTVREFAPADYNNLIQLWRLVNMFNPKTDKKSIILRKYRQNKKMILIAKINNMVIGSILGMGDGWRGTLWRLAVHPKYQRRGIGTRLVKKMEDRLKSAGCKRIILLADKDNAAIKFYHKLGYKKDSNVLYLEKNYYQ